MDDFDNVLLHPLRHLKWTGTFNVRDIGGYPTRSGYQTRWRTVLRGDGYYCLNDAASREALETGIKTIVDLRGDLERLQRPSHFEMSDEVRYISEPLFESGDEMAGPGPSVSRFEAYRLIIDRRRAEFARILDRLAHPAALPALVHCTAGKDRTGIAIALLLALIGVPREIIAADYALSTRYLTGEFIKDGLGRAALRGVTPEEWYRQFPCPPELMARLLDYVDLAYGGVHAYLRTGGLPSASVESLQTLLLI